MTDYGEDGGSFTAIPALNHSDGGLSLIFIQATSILYLTPVDDPVFGAHQLALESNVTTYRADRPAGVLGCLEQVLFIVAPAKFSYRTLLANQPLLGACSFKFVSQEKTILARS